ncbi:MAG: hypothetical protein K2N64_03270 [Anaeroplasmataceae bacterium]|nr:hypothetical protein [Anaeroplasmataceae bacterium]
MSYYKGLVLSEGIAVGRAENLKKESTISHIACPKDEKEKLKDAVQNSIKELEELKVKSKENEEYLSMQILLLSDSILLEKAFKEIEAGKSAIQSISIVILEYINSLLDATSEYLKERVLDLSDIRDRIIRNLNGEEEEHLSSKVIVVAKELHPSFLIQNRTNILGILTMKGGYSSHGAILCRQFSIPYMVADIAVPTGAILILDTRKQQILTCPKEQEIKHYEQIVKKLSEEQYTAVEHKNFSFLANVSDNTELKRVLQYGFDGIGLYRTEMIFMNQNRPLTLEEQYEIYSQAIKAMPDKEICFRTFDIGDDKQLPYLNAFEKGIDNYIHNPVLFKTQIEALLRANQYNSIKLMFPMIHSVAEFLFLKKWVLQIQREIKDTSYLQFGIMLETKEAMEHIDTFTDVDFISIGTNDLVHSIYHIHREDQTLELKAYLDDLIGNLKKVVDFCGKNSISLSICGELAAIGPALREFIKIGVRSFSVATPAIKVLNHVYKEFF